MKNDYELLNETKVDFSKYENIELNDLEKKKMKNGLRGKIYIKKKYNRKIIAVASTVLIVGAMTINTTVVRATIGQLGNKLEQFLGIKNNKVYDDYKKVIGSSVKDKDITFTLNEFLIKKGTAIVNVKVDTREFKKTKVITIFPNIYIDGEKISKGGSTIYKYNDDGTYEMLHQIKLKDIDINKDIKVDIEYSGGEYKQNGKEKGIYGNWTFSINDNGERITQNTKEIDINKVIDLGNGYIYSIRSIAVSPIDIVLKYNTTLMDEKKIKNEEYKYRDISFTIMDTNKNVLILEEGMTSSGNMITGYIECSMFLDKEVQDKLLIVPYKGPDKKYESVEELIKDREYIFDEAIEIELE
ncbi:hypothetical protein A500_01110 [Clostridium sartagoforme AAU1]|uniref:DUF4179 domain-containing protein n=1 Tax=Clostridium sartagoforme AAU1 TaxID=1202534 RepID=R9CGA5_9CLOT|nr:DUF4179 domain-containing protein [Clostridium sartagoforme]EOR28070.1 hypothetical protein A500_01110 [Clostridium sartagoforme AAU1]